MVFLCVELCVVFALMVLFSPVVFRLEAPSSVLRVGVALISNGKLQVHKTPVCSLCCLFLLLLMSLYFVEVNIFFSCIFSPPPLFRR